MNDKEESQSAAKAFETLVFECDLDAVDPKKVSKIRRALSKPSTPKLIKDIPNRMLRHKKKILHIGRPMSLYEVGGIIEFWTDEINIAIDALQE